MPIREFYINLMTRLFAVYGSGSRIYLRKNARGQMPLIVAPNAGQRRRRRPQVRENFFRPLLRGTTFDLCTFQLFRNLYFRVLSYAAVAFRFAYNATAALTKEPSTIPRRDATQTKPPQLLSFMEHGSENIWTSCGGGISEFYASHP